MKWAKSSVVGMVIGVVVLGGATFASTTYWFHVPGTPSNRHVRIASSKLLQAQKAARPVHHTNNLGSNQPEVSSPTHPLQPKVPAPTWPKPQKPYSATEPHPIPIPKLSPTHVDRAAKSATPAPGWHLGKFTLNGAWQIHPSIQVVVGTRMGWPFIVATKNGTLKWYRLGIEGAPGPAVIEAVKGDWVLLKQGYGYQVFNWKTGQRSSSNQNGVPGTHTKLWEN